MVAAIFAACVVWLGSGTGTIVGHDDEFQYVLTCHHVASGETGVAYSPRGRIGVRWIYKDKETDLALGKLFRGHFPEGPYPLKAVSVSSGSVWTAGFVDGRFRQSKMEVQGEVKADGMRRLRLAGREIQPGQSGSPVLTAGGALAGVVSHTFDGGGLCADANQIQEITRLLNRATQPSDPLDNLPTPKLRDVLVGLAAWFFARRGMIAAPAK